MAQIATHDKSFVKNCPLLEFLVVSGGYCWYIVAYPQAVSHFAWVIGM
ncbi:MAG: hypothetical protein KAR47_14240 [Planctomycetes bacterium]|nr:hypothetical protein [Planctomycetota bacterium]